MTILQVKLLDVMEDSVLRKIKFNPQILTEYFDDKVREMCRSCKRFGTKATCPPHIESLEYYKRLTCTYKYGILFIERFEIDNVANWERLGKESSLKLHKEVLDYRNKLINSGHSFVVGFTAGSCKNCEKCTFPCRFPDRSLVPLEGIGIDVVRLVKKIAKIEIKFPVTKYFYRVGVVLYA
jgi:predicted metal-binding protein